VGSRVHGAASACFVAVGLFLCGLGGALAIAEPSASSDLPPGTQTNDVHGNGPKDDSDGSGGSKPKTEKEPQTADEKPGNGENPGNGNCGNDGSNGNAHGCGGGSTETSPPSPSTTNSSTKTSTSSSTATTTSASSTTSTSSTTSASSTSRTTTSKTTTSSETTTSTTTSSVGLLAAGGGGGGGAVEVPSGRPEVPDMQLPPASEPSAIDVVPGVGAAAVELPIPPITLPVIVAPGAGLGAGSAGLPALPAAPRAGSAEPPAGREPLPANVGSNVAVPAASYRLGYTDYLRNAGLSQVAALAVPGVTGMLVLTGAGGWVGYRQAKAGHAVHTNGTARFVN
jgi:hypothetical protein